MRDSGIPVLDAGIPVLRPTRAAYRGRECSHSAPRRHTPSHDQLPRPRLPVRARASRPTERRRVRAPRRRPPSGAASDPTGDGIAAAGAAAPSGVRDHRGAGTCWLGEAAAGLASWDS